MKNMWEGKTASTVLVLYRAFSWNDSLSNTVKQHHRAFTLLGISIIYRWQNIHGDVDRSCANAMPFRILHVDRFGWPKINSPQTPRMTKQSHSFFLFFLRSSVSWSLFSQYDRTTTIKFRKITSTVLLCILQFSFRFCWFAKYYARIWTKYSNMGYRYIKCQPNYCDTCLSQYSCF